VFGPASKWRREIIPQMPASAAASCASPGAEEESPAAPTERHLSRIPWAELLLRVFREDVLLCPRGGRRVVLAFVTEERVVKEILEHLGLPSTGPPIAPARVGAAGEDPGWQDDVPELQRSLRCGRPDPLRPMA
jgi:hypothetical protein